MKQVQESEIHRRAFELLSATQVQTRRWLEKNLKLLDMTYAQFQALDVLVQRFGITQRELAARLESDTTTAMVVCDSLEKRGWLRREADAGDRRVNRLVLTAAGRDAHGRALPILERVCKRLTSALSTEELHGLLPLLEKMRHKAGALWRRSGSRMP